MIDGHDNQIHHDPHTHSLVAALVFGRRGVHVSDNAGRTAWADRVVLVRDLTGSERLQAAG